MEINWVKAYNRLWKIVNGPVYMSGSEYLTHAREVNDSLPSYTTFIESRRQSDRSTSRQDFFWDIIRDMEEDAKHQFFLNMIQLFEHKNPEGLRDLKELFESSKSAILKKEVPTTQLPLEVYKDVLMTLHNCYRSAEQKPSLYLGKGEEDLRDYGLAFLESRYENAAASGEAFNKEGKTDIILKSETGENLFIAECKIWHGKDHFHKSIEQLFGYLTWRDTKAALIFFVQTKKFSEILEKVKEETALSPYYVSQVDDSNETRFSFEFKHRDDEKRKIMVEIMLFSFPNE